MIQNSKRTHRRSLHFGGLGWQCVHVYRYGTKSRLYKRHGKKMICSTGTDGPSGSATFRKRSRASHRHASRSEVNLRRSTVMLQCAGVAVARTIHILTSTRNSGMSHSRYSHFTPTRVSTADKTIVPRARNDAIILFARKERQTTVYPHASSYTVYRRHHRRPP